MYFRLELEKPFISGKAFHLSQGEMVIIPANQPHALKAIDRFKMLLVMIKSW